MAAHLARRIDEPAHGVEAAPRAQGPGTPEDFMVAISAAMNESVRFVHRLAAQGHARFPDDPELARLSRLLDLPPGREALRLFTPEPGYGFSWHPLPPAKEVADPSAPEEFLADIRLLLDHASPTHAQRVAAEGHRRFPDHPELERLCRLLTLPPARSIPGSDKKKKGNREQAYRWLDENEIHHQGQWVALGDEGFLASAPTLDELMTKIEPVDPENPPLVHHIH